MNKFYNTQESIASAISTFLLKVDPNIRKTQLNIIPYIILGMILSSNSTASKIATTLKGDFSLIKHESIIKRIKRFFTNKIFNSSFFYDKIIRYVISNYKCCHKDKRIHIVFDHMFSHENYTVFMMSMRIGKQGIPLWFRCFKGNKDPEAFDIDFINQGISYVSSLFDDSYKLIFLADRWFNSTKIFEHINSLGHTYCIRLKGYIKVYIYNERKRKYEWVSARDISSMRGKSKIFYDVNITEKAYTTNLVISKRDNVKEPWIIVTNGNPQRAIKDYGYRFGGIETIFKNQKSNGFYIESTVNCSLKYFETMYTMVSFAVLFLTLYGADYTKNSSSYKHVKLTTHKVIKGVRKRVKSLFNIGLTLFQLAYNSIFYIRIPFSFTLYDL